MICRTTTAISSSNRGSRGCTRSPFLNSIISFICDINIAIVIYRNTIRVIKLICSRTTAISTSNRRTRGCARFPFLNSIISFICDINIAIVIYRNTIRVIKLICSNTSTFSSSNRYSLRIINFLYSVITSVNDVCIP